MSDIIDRLRFAGRFGFETEEQAAARRIARNNEAADEIARLRAEVARLEAAPTETPAPSCIECGGPLQWRCPACRIAQSKAVAEAPAPAEAPAVPSCPRIALVVAIHTLASHFENALYKFRGDEEAHRKAKGDIAHARKVAAEHNQNGPGCAALASARESGRREGREAEFDDGSTFTLTGWAGGAAPGGRFSTVTCEHKDAAGRVTVMRYVRQDDDAIRALP